MKHDLFINFLQLLPFYFGWKKQNPVITEPIYVFCR